MSAELPYSFKGDRQAFAQQMRPQDVLVPPVAVLEPDGDVECDIAILGFGMGGSTLAYALRESGARVILVERGDFLGRGWENWSPEDVHLKGRYTTTEDWYDNRGTPFGPGVYYYVGGNTKVFGACLPRFREAAFGPIEPPNGVSRPWPVSYAEMEPFYAEAERMYLVHGHSSEDPTDPWRSTVVDRYFELKALGVLVTRIGDAIASRSMMEAVHKGERAARNV